MTVRPHCRHPLHLVTCMFGMFVLMSLLTCREGHAAPVCRSVKCAQQVQRIVAAQVVTPVLSPYYAQPSLQLQQQAMATYDFRSSPEYLDYLRLKGFEAGVAAVTAQQGAGQAVDSDTPSAPAPQTEPQPPAEPTPAVTQEWQERYPTLVANCAKCHSADSYEDDRPYINGTDAMDDDDALRLMKAIRSGRMPKNHGPLDPQTRFDIYEELLTEYEVPEPEGGSP